MSAPQKRRIVIVAVLVVSGIVFGLGGYLVYRMTQPLHQQRVNRISDDEIVTTASEKEIVGALGGVYTNLLGRYDQQTRKVAPEGAGVVNWQSESSMETINGQLMQVNRFTCIDQQGKRLEVIVRSIGVDHQQREIKAKYEGSSGKTIIDALMELLSRTGQ
jgi:hypothetical protein